jgi:hypothetical protein
MARAKVVEESWPSLQVRLHELRADLQRMLDQLNGKKRPPRFWKHERQLRKWLQAAIHWVDVLASRPTPPTGKDAAAFVMALYELDEQRPKVIDDFHRLMEANGELYFVG